MSSCLGGDGVGGFAGLGDEEADFGGVGDGVAVAIFAGVVDVDGEAGEALDHELAGEAGVPAGAAGGDGDAGGGAEFGSGVMCMSGRKTWPVSRETRPRVVSRTARGCSLISLSMKCL